MSILQTLGLRGGSRAEAENEADDKTKSIAEAKPEGEADDKTKSTAEAEDEGDEEMADEGAEAEAAEDEDDAEMAQASARVRRAEGRLPKTARKAARGYAEACVGAAHARASAVLSHPAAKGREAMALTLVCDTSLTVRQAVKRLEAMPKAGAGGVAGLGAAIEAHAAAPLAPGGRISGDKSDAHGWERSVAKVNSPRSFN